MTSLESSQDEVGPLPRTAPPDYTDQRLYARTRAAVERAVTIIPDAYREQAFWQVEREQVFARSWVPVTCSSRVGGKRIAQVVELAGREVLIWRNRDGQLRAFHNVCRHRGTQLLPPGCHELAFNGVRCPYHSWAYDLDGRCMGTPYFEGSGIPPEMKAAFDTDAASNFDKRDYGLLSVHVAEWGGLIFINLAEETAPLETQLGDLPGRLDHYQLHDWTIQADREYEVNANYKLIAENFMECYHLPWVHPELVSVSPVENHYRWQGRGLYTGMCTTPISADTPAGGWQSLPAFSGIGDRDADTGRFVLLFPNTAMAILPNHVFVLIAHPLGPDRTREETFILSHPECVGDGELAAQGIAQLHRFWDLVNQQDIDIVERVQRGLNGPAFPGGRLCYHFEEPVHRFQNMIIDKMVGIERIPEGDTEEAMPMFRPRRTSVRTG
ncbi:aromatic ring-hydroxylating oxygenase subunit alpha [Salinisphaera aquimarina]|uniref:Aromatic ring-hydroxylating dioxygenase subunit alpha n=1 Tax=Salinisphaera aquimarina TaxID=2094031 RepID=A0ABV7EQV6_9GAMM